MPGLFSRKSKQLPPRRDIARARQAEVESTSHDQSYTFRRNNTITGSAASSVSSLNERGSQLKSSRVQAHDLTRRRRHVGMIFIGSVAICLTLFFLLLQFTANLTLTINGDASVEPQAEYASTIESYYARSPLERLRFMVNGQALERYIQRQHPEVASIAVGGSESLGTSHFSLAMRQPVAVWHVNGQDRFVDQHGSSFGRNYFDRPTVKIIDKSGIRNSSGEAVASDSFLGFVGQVVGSVVAAHDLKVTQIIIPPGTTRQIEVMLDGVEYPIKFSTDRPPAEQAEDMARALKWLRGHGNPALEYLDVRVSGRAFYREA